MEIELKIELNFENGVANECIRVSGLVGKALDLGEMDPKVEGAMTFLLAQTHNLSVLIVRGTISEDEGKTSLKVAIQSIQQCLGFLDYKESQKETK